MHMAFSLIIYVLPCWELAERRMCDGDMVGVYRGRRPAVNLVSPGYRRTVGFRSGCETSADRTRRLVLGDDEEDGDMEHPEWQLPSGLVDGGQPVPTLLSLLLCVPGRHGKKRANGCVPSPVACVGRDLGFQGCHSHSAIQRPRQQAPFLKEDVCEEKHHEVDPGMRIISSPTAGAKSAFRSVVAGCCNLPPSARPGPLPVPLF